MTAPGPYTPRLLTCDVLYTGMGGGHAPGGVVVVGETVAATGDPAELRRAYPHAREEHVGGVIAPPPVNAHTHLDMSAYDFQALPYFRWLPEVVVAQRELRGVGGAQAGADTLARLGVGGVGDIVWSPDVMDALLDRNDLTGVLYFEVLGAFPEHAEERFAALRARIEGWRARGLPEGLRVGVTPHTPFTVSHRLLRLVTEYAHGEGLPMQIHVAEHPSEPELFETGAGPLWEHRLKPFTPDTFAQVIGRDPEPGLTPVRYLDELGVLERRPTLIHMVNVTLDDIARVARAGCAVVTCPRSNHHLECGVFPWAAYAAAGVEVAVGTDSVASGGSLDVRDDVAFARTLYPDLDPRVLVRAAVKGGHRVLGSRAPFLRRGEPWRDAYVW
ncbi:cytosine/adenosine deaminase-related metal-dependent hydrolase [Deinococcus metalli]|uniref:Aminodeoxyfutalosine deaminase n=1 Tax=Deinococcus metalli TaxID=1141878 RepID=A0A7W8KIZ3_9DEIO|nr:amidohydrolase family protein [Deinococcus metalli]MBB5377836.1 cytosine/adenosine deaminase-related metal-dependent hydrolase [Deinococcus metalli]GHF55580.1 aminodeoxyfutalosine deaminase [Deinococcus metalli]